MGNEIAMYLLSGFILLIGAFSLITQKITAKDRETGEEVEIKLPFWGKLKTNYPALGFVFIGAALAAFTYSKACEMEQSKMERQSRDAQNWTISGEFVAPEGELIDWTEGHVTLHPMNPLPTIAKNGTFQITGTIQKGKRFEDIVKQISYENYSGKIITATIITDEAYETFTSGETGSLLKNAGENTRYYRAVSVDISQPSP